MKVYIASPYTLGDVAINVRKSLAMADELRDAGFLPYCPLLTHFWHMVFPHPYSYWLQMDLEWLRECDCLLRMPGESRGADKEVETMLLLGKPVVYSKGELIALAKKTGL